MSVENFSLVDDAIQDVMFRKIGNDTETIAFPPSRLMSALEASGSPYVML